MKGWIAQGLLRLAFKLDRDLAEEQAIVWVQNREFRLAYERLMRKISAMPINIARDPGDVSQPKGEGVVMDGLRSEDGETIYFWPYCQKCFEPYSFDDDGPWASCACGTGEWGYPRPAPWIPDPHKTQRIVDVATNVRDNLAKAPLERIPATGKPGETFRFSEASYYASRAYAELDGVLKS